MVLGQHNKNMASKGFDFMHYRNNNRSILCVLLMACLISACSFKLRGLGNNLTELISSIQVESTNQAPGFNLLLKNKLKQQGIQKAEESDAKLQIHRVFDDRLTISYSNRAKSSQYGLIREVEFSYKYQNEVLINRAKIRTNRTYFYQEETAVGKTEEEILLKKEMSEEIISKMLTQIEQVMFNELEDKQ